MVKVHVNTNKRKKNKYRQMTIRKGLINVLDILQLKDKLKILIRFSSKSYWRNKNNLILIYTSGKVGGTSTSQTIKQKLRHSNVYHLHYLFDLWLNETKNWDASENNMWIRQSKLVWPLIKTSKNIKIVTIVRDPIAIHISGEFENSINFGDDLINVDENTIIEFIKTKGFYYPTRWFNEELFKLVEIDFHDIPVYEKHKMNVVMHKNVAVLFLKFEDLNTYGTKHLSEFLKIDIKQLLRKNMTSNKPTKDLYKRVVENFGLPKNELNAIYNQPVIQKFYSEKEIIAFKKKWAN